MRDVAKAGPLLDAAEGLDLAVVPLDVTDPTSIERAFAAVQADGPLDALVNNAGIAGAAPFEETTDAENRAMFETNYFGPVRCIQQVLPQMRERGAGVIVNVTSLSGLFPWPNQACYAASKWALEAVGLTLAHEVHRFGVRVVNVEPGAVQTAIVDNARDRIRYDRNSPYRAIMRRNGKLIAAGFREMTTPDDVAAVIVQAMTSTSDQVQWPAGADAVAIAEARSIAPLGEWVALGGDVADADYNAWFNRHLNIAL
jgi:NAD(P)-dependent dehydrogenase (short-subunit alcohol dehydrogenase family)